MDQRLTIEELARRTGMTVRNIRAHQTRGLLPPPTLAGRTGYYGADHAARLELIRDMQRAGFNLASIKRLLDAAPAGEEDELLRLERALLSPWAAEEPRVYDADELNEMFGSVGQAVAAKVEELGVLTPIGNGRYEAASPRLLKAGAELVALGVPLERVVRVLEDLTDQARRVAASFVGLFLDTVWRSFEDEGRPQERWREVREAVERLRPLSSDALLVVFQQAMTSAVEEAFGAELVREAQENRRAG
jgi:DNA-binding transcriptional MerR regulator